MRINAQCTFEQTYKYYPEPGSKSHTIATSDGGALTVMTCYFDPIHPLGGNYSDIAIVKNDSCGNTLWQMHYGEAGVNDDASGCIETNDGNYLVAGTTENGPALANFWVVKFSKTGIMIWDSTYNGTTESVCFGISKRQDKNSAFIYGYLYKKLPNLGYKYDVPFILEIDENGNTLKRIDLKFHYTPAHNYITELFQPNDSTFDIIEVSDDTLYLIQTDTAFNIKFNKALFYRSLIYYDACISNDLSKITIAASFTDSFAFTRDNIVTIDGNGNFIRRKIFSMNDTLPSTSCITSTKDGGFLVGGYLLKLDSNFIYTNKSWYKTARGGLGSIVELTDGRIIAAGATDLHSTVYPELYIIKTDSVGRYAKVGIEEIINNRVEFSFRIYPNPATSELNIETNSNEILHAQLYDISGKLILEDTSFKNSVNINLQNLGAGLYFIQIRDSNNRLMHYQKLSVAK